MSRVENVFINKGQFAEFSCKFVSNPLAENVTWFKNEFEEIEENDKYLVISKKKYQLFFANNIFLEKVFLEDVKDWFKFKKVKKE